MVSLGFGGAVESRERLGARELPRIVREIVVGRLFLDKNLQRQNEPRLIVERARGKGVMIGPEQVIVEGAAAHLAKCPLRPLRRLVGADVLRALERDFTVVSQADVGSRGPAPAHAAMTDVDLALGDVCLERHGAAKASSADGCHYGHLLAAHAGRLTAKLMPCRPSHHPAAHSPSLPRDS